ncbi:MAG: hypothetical protein AAF899_17495 [Pseudomonadota bacterium]
MSVEVPDRQQCLDLIGAGEGTVPEACARFIEIEPAVFDGRAEVAVLLLGLLAILVAFYIVIQSGARRRVRQKRIGSRGTGQ